MRQTTTFRKLPKHAWSRGSRLCTTCVCTDPQDDSAVQHSLFHTRMPYPFAHNAALPANPPPRIWAGCAAVAKTTLDPCRHMHQSAPESPIKNTEKTTDNRI